MMQKLSFLIFPVLIFIPFLAGAQTFPNSPEPWTSEYNIDVSKVDFSQYMTVYNAKERTTILERIAAKQQPQYDTYLLLLEEAEKQMHFKPNPPEMMKIMGGYESGSNLSKMREILWNHAYAAYTCALAYDLSGREEYAEIAISVLMAWVKKGTTFTGADSGLQLGSFFNPMLYAADLLKNYPGWSETEQQKFESWWRDEVLIGGEVLRVMRVKDNNWKDAGLLGVISAAVVFQDRELLREAVIHQTSFFYPRRDSSVRIPGGSWKFEKDEKGEYLPREVVRNDGRSGLTYTAYALTTMAQHFEIARYCGFNHWNKVTTNGASLQGVILHYYEWDILNNPFAWNKNPKRTNTRRNIYEISNNIFDLGTDFRKWIGANRPLNGNQGDPWITLTKGDLFQNNGDHP